MAPSNGGQLWPITAEVLRVKMPVESKAKRLPERKDARSRRSGYDTHVQLVESYFDTNAQDWSDYYQKVQQVNDLVLTTRKDTAVAFLCSKLPTGSKILDAGCGAGLVALDLVHKGFFVHGVDVSQNMLDLCEQHFTAAGIVRSHYVFTKTDLVLEALPVESFDGVMALGFLQYQVDELQALEGLSRLLRPGGVLVVSGPVNVKLSNYFGLAEVGRAIVRRLRRARPKPNSSSPSVLLQISRHNYSVRRFSTLLCDAGFEIIKYRGHGFVHFEFISGRMGFKGQLFLHRFFSRLSDFLPIGRWGNDLICVAKKKA